jgi:hypothetical protein
MYMTDFGTRQLIQRSPATTTMMLELSAAVKAERIEYDVPGRNTPLSTDFEQWLSYLVEKSRRQMRFAAAPGRRPQVAIQRCTSDGWATMI